MICPTNVNNKRDSIKEIDINSTTILSLYNILLQLSPDKIKENDAEMKKVLAEIQDGTFARNWINECNTNQIHFKTTRKLKASHPLEAVGKELRKMYSWNEEK